MRELSNKEIEPEIKETEGLSGASERKIIDIITNFMTLTHPTQYN